MGGEELAAGALVVERNRIRHSRGGTMACIIVAISSGGILLSRLGWQSPEEH
jgi:hypothetical protein